MFEPHRKSKHPLYRVWATMRNRCYNKKVWNYERYGGRGINVCEEWRSGFEPFYNFAISAGWEPGLQIDRTDNSGDYSPQNCRFVTPSENAANRRRRKNKSGYTGVYANYRKFGVRATINGKRLFVGNYASLPEAVEARKKFIAANESSPASLSS